MSKRLILWGVRIVFSLSLFFAVYAISQMMLEKKEVDLALNKWENRESFESPVSSLQIDLTNAGASETNNKNITYPIKGDVFGKLSIPKLHRELPIIYGTDNEELAKGVGHYIGSAFPGERNNVVLAGHRDTVFRGLDSVKVGDRVLIETDSGEYTYEVFDQSIVSEDDLSVLLSNEEAILTLITCYPFNYIGPAPKRYILKAQLVKQE
ncbi:class D sortase [Litchfieldia salsa]|uniref:Sortase A n=1 Tax=Litchfieldia salsa TaxID=930152 RepID=A0A1H0VDW5_9BACI|nr:class D sortase [Litchfieldia salsa]SDP76544.1 sortase A [Litchfieldia salsa]